MFPYPHPRAIVLRAIEDNVEQACRCLLETIRCVVFAVRTVYALITAPERVIAGTAIEPLVKTADKKLDERIVAAPGELEVLPAGNAGDIAQNEVKKRTPPYRRIRFNVDADNNRGQDNKNIGRNTAQDGAVRLLTGEGLENEKFDLELLWSSGDKKGLIDYITNVLQQDILYRGKKDRDHFERLQEYMLSRAKDPQEKKTLGDIFQQVEGSLSSSLSISAKVNATSAADLEQEIDKIDKKIDRMEKTAGPGKDNETLIKKQKQLRAEHMLALEQQKDEIAKNWAPSVSWSKPECKPQTFTLRRIRDNSGLEDAKMFVRNQRSEKILKEMLKANLHGDLESVIRARLEQVQAAEPREGENKS